MIYKNIWDFLHVNPFLALTIQNLKKFSCDATLYDDLHDRDLPRLLIKELEDYISNYLSTYDSSLCTKDALFDLFLSVSDFYQDKKEILRQIEQNLLKSPTLLHDFYMYTDPSILFILKTLKIEKIDINKSVIPFIGTFDLPGCFTPLILKGLAGYFIYLFLHCATEEDLMTQFNEKLDCLNIPI